MDSNLFRLNAAVAIIMGFQHYVVMLGTTVIIPSIIVPLMGGGNVRIFSPFIVRTCRGKTKDKRSSEKLTLFFGFHGIPSTNSQFKHSLMMYFDKIYVEGNERAREKQFEFVEGNSLHFFPFTNLYKNRCSKHRLKILLLYMAAREG